MCKGITDISFTGRHIIYLIQLGLSIITCSCKTPNFYSKLWLNDCLCIIIYFILTNFKQAIEDAGGKSETETQDEDKLNQDLKEMREALDEKSKNLAERTEGAAKYDAFNLGGVGGGESLNCC